MAIADLIPTGRTSLVKRGDGALQVQTEYAHRPVPRITTTVQKNGQVLQKIDRNLDAPIANIEEKNRMETTIRKQHAEIVAIIENETATGAILPPTPGPTAEPKPYDPKPYPEPDRVLTTVERLNQIPGEHRVFRLDNEGNFLNADVSREFARMFKSVFKNLRSIVTIFSTVSGVGLTRETGVYEIQHDSLYLISVGTEIYILCVQVADYSIDYEKEIRTIVTDL